MATFDSHGILFDLGVRSSAEVELEGPGSGVVFTCDDGVVSAITSTIGVVPELPVEPT